MYRMFIWIKSVFITSLLVLLTSCGGGGGAGSTLNPESELVPELDALDLNGPLFDQYSGATTASSLDAGNLELFISLALSDMEVASGNISKFGSLSFRSNVSGFTKAQISSKDKTSAAVMSRAVLDKSNCELSGTSVLQGNINDDSTGELELIYDQCNDGEVTLHGSVTIFVVNGTPDSFESVAFFKKVLMTESGTQYRLSGRVHSRDIPNSITSKITTDMVFIDQDTLVQMKLDNYITSSCVDCPFEYEEDVRGRIYHSDYGYIDVSTTEALLHDDFFFDPRVTGQVKFEGAGGASLLLNFKSIETVRYNTINELVFIVGFELDQNGDGSYDRIAVLPLALIGQDVVYDFADDDNDGMPNGWEVFFGFDPSSNIDAELDADNDGFSNQLEYFRYGNPLNDEVAPVVTDLSIEFDVITDIARAGQDQKITVRFTNPNPEYGATDITVTITKSPNIQWDDLGICILVDGNPDQVTCSIEYVLQNSGRALSVYIVGESEEFTMTAEVESSTFDNDLSNNSASLTDTITKRQSDLALLPDFYISQNTYYDMAAIDFAHVFDIYIDHVVAVSDTAYNTVFTMSLPDKVTVLSANYFIGGEIAAVCTIATEIVCDIGTYEHDFATSDAFIRVEVMGDTEGYGEYTATITSDSIDPEPSNNSFTQQIFVGESLSSVQQQIDESVGPLTINLDAGMYVGGLDFSGKQVTVNGNSTPGATIVKTVSPVTGLLKRFHLDSDGVVRNIYFLGKEGEADPAMSFTGSNTLIENNMYKYHYIDGGYDATDVTIRGNILSSGCAGIYFNGDGSVRVENNLIFDSTCSAISFFNQSPFAEGVISSVISNNTIVNTNIAIRSLVALSGNDLIIQNNILINNLHGINVEVPEFYDVIPIPYSVPEITNNLFFNNTYDVVASDSLNLTPFDVGDNLIQAPLFVDAASSDYRLDAGSPAIDTGTNVDAPNIDLDNETRPVDGNEDAILETDIGAFEYQP